MAVFEYPNAVAVRDGFPVAHITDSIQSKEAANRQKDRESLPRLRKVRDWWLKHQP